VLSGLLIGAGRGVVWAVIVGLGCIGAAAFAQTLRPLLTPEVDGREPAAVST
jgi:hypothetical protein